MWDRLASRAIKIRVLAMLPLMANGLDSIVWDTLSIARFARFTRTRTYLAFMVIDWPKVDSFIIPS
jgi:hypothetical protein